MSSNVESDPAFKPCDHPAFVIAESHRVASLSGLEWTNGLSKRELAAIHLCVPMSGSAWLDDMIREASILRLTEAIVSSLDPTHQHWIRFADKQKNKNSDDMYIDFVLGMAMKMLDRMQEARGG